MTRKLLPLALVLALAAAACSAPPHPEIDFGSGVRFVPMVADSLNDSGLDSSVVPSPDGLPVVAYFAFPEDVPEGTLPAARPVDAPTIPGVLMASANEEGLWTRGAIALQAEVPSVSVPFNPAVEETVGDLAPDNVSGLRMVADGDAFHAVWGSGDGIFYATGSLDPATGAQVQVSRVTDTPRVGPSIAVDGGGTPWIAFYTSTSSSASVEVATPSGQGWSIETVDQTRGCDLCRTAVLARSNEVLVAYSDGGSGVSVATQDGDGGWASGPVTAFGGQGLSGTATGEGWALAFNDPENGQVTVANGTPGSFESRPVAEVPRDALTADWAGTSIAADDEGTLWVAWTDGDGVRFASGDGTELAPIDTGADTLGGRAPSIAVAPDRVTAWLSWYDPGTQDLLVGGYGDLTGLAIAGGPAEGPTGPTAGTGPTGATGPPPCEPDGTALTIAAPVGAAGSGFDKDCLAVPAGEPFTIEFDNQDGGVQHNVAIYSADPLADASAEMFLQGEIITGPDSITYEGQALDAGIYFFRCDVHPTTMTGTFVVAGGGGGGGATGATGPTGATGGTGTTGGGGGATTTTVTASGLAFDTGTITLAAGQDNVITFVNDDTGVQHNIAIYTDDTLSEELFGGTLITGPDQIDYTIPPLEAGEYYFLCIVHPTMNGTVVVR